MVNLKIWNECVASAKSKFGVTKYGFISGKVLKEAQKAYYTIMISK